MKLLKIIIAITLGGLLLGAPLPVLAAGNAANPQPAVSFLPERGKDDHGPWFHGKVKVIQGEVSAVGTGTITVDDKPITVPEGTRIQWPGQKDATLSDIQVGMRVVVLVDETDSTLTAHQIIVIPSKPGPPEYQHQVGEVTDYTAATSDSDGSITIKDKSGETTTFTIIFDKFKILPPGATVEVGKWVTVLSHRDPVQDKLIAFGVVVHTEKPSEGPWAGLESITGTVSISGDTITVDTTSVTYDDATIFVLRGVPTADGQTATIFYKTQTDGTKLAKFVLVNIDLPGARAGLEEG
jgi:hypothetical protein